MGAAVSRADTSENACHVLQVTPNSPGEKAGLQSYFDFIISANGVALENYDSSFVEILNTNVGKPVTLEVFNATTSTTRATMLTPNRDWGGPGLAGITVRMNNVSKALTLVWHVLDVASTGPARSAGLEAVTDYIIGVPGYLFYDSDDFFNHVKVNLKQPISIYVYSTRTKSIRVAQVTPDPDWGGVGFLGCDVAFGLNHRLDIASRDPSFFSPSTSPTSVTASTTTSAASSDSANQKVNKASTPPAAANVPQSKHNHHVHDVSCKHEHNHDHQHDHAHPTQPQNAPPSSSKNSSNSTPNDKGQRNHNTGDSNHQNNHPNGAHVHADGSTCNHDHGGSSPHSHHHGSHKNDHHDHSKRDRHSPSIQQMHQHQRTQDSSSIQQQNTPHSTPTQRSQNHKHHSPSPLNSSTTQSTNTNTLGGLGSPGGPSDDKFIPPADTPIPKYIPSSMFSPLSKPIPDGLDLYEDDRY